MTPREPSAGRLSGQLSVTSLPELLEASRSSELSGEIRLKTDFGGATIWLDRGEPQDAVFADLTGEAALVRLLGVSDGDYELVHGSTADKPRAIAASLSELLSTQRQRRERWAAAVKRLPPLSAVPEVALVELEAAERTWLTALAPLIHLVDGRRAIVEVIEDSGRDAVVVAEELAELLDRGVLACDGSVPPPSQREAVQAGPASSLESPATERLSVPPPLPSRRAATLGRYEVLSHLARGGTGAVYLARDREAPGMTFAVKVLRSHLTNNDEAYQMLAREARLASKFRHPNLVRVIDFGSHEQQPYLVMEYVPGCSLADLLRDGSTGASLGAAVSIVIDTLEGLHAAHTLVDEEGASLGVVHHDVSPQNILVGVDGIAKVTDFGVAELAQDDAGLQARGKPGYTAPERISGGQGDCRSDLFSAGVVLWQTLTRQSLFGSGSVQEVLGNVLTRPIPPPSAAGPSPPQLDAICLKALHRNPERRYQSAQEMAEQLAATAGGLGLVATRAEVGRWVREVMSRDVDLERLHFLDARLVEQGPDESPVLTYRYAESPEREGLEPSRTVNLPSTRGAGRFSRKTVVAVALLLLIVAFLIPRKVAIPSPSSPQAHSP